LEDEPPGTVWNLTCDHNTHLLDVKESIDQDDPIAHIGDDKWVKAVDEAILDTIFEHVSVNFPFPIT